MAFVYVLSAVEVKAVWKCILLEERLIERWPLTTKLARPLSLSGWKKSIIRPILAVLSVHLAAFCGIAGQGTSNNTARGTVAVGIAVAEGLALVGDSRVTLRNPQWDPTYKVVSDSHQKLMAIGKVGLATFGTAFVLGRSTYSWVQDFLFELKTKNTAALTVDQVLAEFRAFFGPKVVEHRKTEQGAVVGFLVAGYDASGVGRIFLLVFPDGTSVERTNTKDRTGITWQGETDTIQRIVLGVDMERFFQLQQYRDLENERKKQIREGLGPLEYTIFYDFMSLQDALDLASFLVQATVTMQRFSFGTHGNVGALPDVGGPVDSLVITPDGLRWVHRKEVAPTGK